MEALHDVLPQGAAVVSLSKSSFKRYLCFVFIYMPTNKDCAANILGRRALEYEKNGTEKCSQKNYGKTCTFTVGKISFIVEVKNTFGSRLSSRTRGMPTRCDVVLHLFIEETAYN